MQIDPDIVYVVVECLSNATEPLSQEAILEEVPFDRRHVTGALHGLYACGFLERAAPAGKPATDYFYALAKVVTAYHIIKVGEMGLDLGSLSGLVKISDKQKQAALALASQAEKLAQLDDAARMRRIETAAKSAVSKPLPRDSVVDTLERLALASDMSIKEMKGAKGGEEVVRALQEARQEAIKALAAYQAQLQAGGANHVGF